MRKHKVLSFLSIVACLVFLVACYQAYDSEQTYFSGSIAVHYHQTNGSEDDYVSFTFNRVGTYEIYFAYTAGKETLPHLPANFTIVVAQAPLIKVVSQSILPDYLTITIKNGTSSEQHDFS